DDDVVVAHVRRPGRRLDADVRRGAADHQRAHTAAAQLVLQGRAQEGVIARLADHRVLVADVETAVPLGAPRARDAGPGALALPTVGRFEPGAAVGLDRKSVVE